MSDWENTIATGQQNNDYKYILQDISTMYLGARYTYRELTEVVDIPFKVKNMVNHYILPELGKEEITEDISLESHFYYMEEKGFAYQTYLQLKTKVKFNVLQEKKGFGGKVKKSYTTEVMKLQDFVKIPPAEKEAKGIMIQEISISKLALMGL